MMWIRKKLLLVLFCLLLVLPWACFSQEDSKDYWEEQREYYRQYSAWELPTEAIIAFLDQMEDSENKLTSSQKDLEMSQDILKQLKKDTEKLQSDYDLQQSLLVLAGGVVAAETVILTILLLVK
jgi:lipid II:glycine glycyltransferase (peptidoglycan interpeptide bridge formation enzyme)